MKLRRLHPDDLIWRQFSCACKESYNVHIYIFNTRAQHVIYVYKCSHKHARTRAYTRRNVCVKRETQSRCASREMYINIRGDSQSYRRIYGFFGAPEQSFSFLLGTFVREYLVTSAKEAGVCKSIWK